MYWFGVHSVLNGHSSYTHRFNRSLISLGSLSMQTTTHLPLQSLSSQTRSNGFAPRLP